MKILFALIFFFGESMSRRKEYSSSSITVKKVGEMEQMLDYLENKFLLNTASVVRYCISQVYYDEIKKEGEN